MAIIGPVNVGIVWRDACMSNIAAAGAVDQEFSSNQNRIWVHWALEILQIELAILLRMPFKQIENIKLRLHS